MNKIIQNLDVAGGILLIICSALTLMWANVSPDTYLAFNSYQLFAGFDTKHFVNDVLMTPFFFLIGLEVVHEAKHGALKSKEKVMLPLVAAISGFIIPAVLYVTFVGSNSENISGWAIPTATDIAFALGVLALLGKRVPSNLKVLLMAIAVIDDLLAIVTIAIFYTDQIQIPMLISSLFCIAVMHHLHRNNIKFISAYVGIGLILWFSMYNAGIHATLAGVITAIFIPRCKDGFTDNMEHCLHGFVALIVVPVFAVCNAGVSFSGGVLESLDSVALAVALGLLVGKPLGIVTATIWCTKTGLAKLPEGVNTQMIVGISILCSIGFTMSIYIGSLAGLSNESYKIGILLAAAIATVLGMSTLMVATKEDSSIRP
ncbi:Na+/H+ antiporter NhaA [Vibrio sp. D431a]|uniref:Na+/H+ antiporter NhaA n=1 Tax=Vibrio sp. D431a TaxID=2837388 RepID=UPI0025533CB0|nr:Na+/H+ antiporter NhaA [Vibrio sp. D431a]MDK9790143.1 Na+/H+ antiporter NhaA [Vibrio sp. D431a]